ncbi:hypothetical protein T069G_01277 [Trichoderma breve]|uniref:RING-type domain-containing protein n=1 Tax=Trichoderma breve TaxID=2034170 RepID=A0A9W9EDG5_9HYPO|nr:hypothetical protein T069G_01277 [Trichoderma breve]KAJ4864747.1 hypothetical protein T069G_01277 [Trichoderma breve]
MVNLKSDREEAVKELFPRLLYNFSDVVVHVMTESTMREMESELTRLIQWAQNSLHTAVNRAILPRLIVIVNKCPRGVKTWDPIQTTEEILHQQSESVKHNKVMQSYLKMHGFKLEKEEQEDASEGEENAAIEVNKENPVEGKEEVPVEGKKETQVEGKKEDPAEDKKEDHVEEEIQKLVEDKKEDPAEDKNEDPVEEKIQNPVEDTKEDSVEGKKEDPIATLGSLLGRCYSSVEIIRLPTVDNQDVFSEQLQALDESIRDAVSKSEKQKIASRCWITTEMQSRLFTAAFDHYKESLDKPFDFLESLYSITPVEDSLATSCFELLKQARKAGPGTNKLMTAEEFPKVVTPVLCSMVALDSCRSPIKYPGSLKDRYRGKSIEVHDSHEVGLGDTSTMTYQVRMSKALAEFLDRACPCEYQDKSGNICVNSRLSHDNVLHHQNSFGTVIGNGTYESDFADKLLLWWDKEFDGYINAADIKLDGTTSSVTLPGQLEKGDERLTWAAHLKVIQQLYGIMPALNFTGMGICCWCFNKSVRLLDCGHDICWKCAQMMGEQVVFEKVDPFFRMYNCNLHPKTHTFERPIYIHLGRPRE